MAFFEFLNTIGNAIGNLVKPVGGGGTGGFEPDPNAYMPLGPDTDGAGIVQQDAWGHVSTRGPVITDEGSFRDSFSGASLYTGLTGTVTVGPGDTTVVGVGTLFLSEIGRQDFFRAAADVGYVLAPQVSRVLSDTELELAEPYGSVGGAGVAAQRSFWHTVTTPGGSLAVANSKVALTVDTTNGAKAEIHRAVDFPPLLVTVRASLSQRIVNQYAEFGVESASDNLRYPNQVCKVVLDGVAAGSIKFVVACSAAAADTVTQTLSLPSGLTTAVDADYTITLTGTVASLAVNGVLLSRVTYNLPNPYGILAAFSRVVNTGVTASNTTLSVEDFAVNNTDILQVANTARAEPLGVRNDDEVHRLEGIKQTNSSGTNQVICSAVVPTGRTAFLVGFIVSSDTAGAAGNPIKIGRSPWTEAAAPGAVDGDIAASFVLPAGQDRTYTVGGAPAWLANAGDTIGVVVNPSAATVTQWRATLFYILR